MRVLINLWQTQEERRGKYWLCRAGGMNRNQATRMKDWRLSKIERFFGLEPTYTNREGHDRELNELIEGHTV